MRDHHSDQLDRIEERLRFVQHVLVLVHREEHEMAITQEQFDQDLAVLFTAIQDLIAAVEAKPAADLTAEDQNVLAAVQTVKDELAKLTPEPAPEPAPEPTPEPGV